MNTNSYIENAFFSVLKNQYLSPGYDCWFKYYTKYDLFEVDGEGEKAWIFWTEYLKVKECPENTL